MTGRAEPSEALLSPCRAYHPGDHARWLRGRLTRSMLLAAVVGGVVAPAPGLLVAFATPTLLWPAAAIAGWSGFVLFPLIFAVAHWASFGARRWAALELVIWAGRFAAARYQAATGIRDPADRERAASWLASHPHAEGEPAETSYWRAFVLLLLGRAVAARAELSHVPAVPEWERDRATLAAQIDIAEALPIDIGALEGGVLAMAASDERAVAAIELGALRSQVAWTCGADDVAPVLATLPLVEGRAAGTLLRHYWLPLVVTTALAWAALALLLSLLR